MLEVGVAYYNIWF